MGGRGREGFSVDDVISQSRRGSKLRGAWPAIVADNKDGEGNPGYRVKVKFPWLNDQDTTFWARIAVPMGGSGRGTYVLPDIDDQVLVVFEHGDINRPIVVGALWSKKQEPVEVNQSGKNNTKLIKSRCGHRIIFDDKEGAEKITLVDKTKKNKIVLDSVNKIVKVESDGDIEVIAKANAIMHSNALKIGARDGITGKAASLLTHSAKTFGLKATSGITIGGGNTTINVSNAAACSVSGSGAGELGAPGIETPKDQVAEARGSGGGGSGAGGGGAGGGGTGGAGGGGSGGGGGGASSGATPLHAAFVLELEDVLFHFDSAVLLADFDANRCSAPGQPQVSGLAALRSTFLQLRDHPAQTLLIAGHTDTSGSSSYNQPLSEERARNVLAALRGDRSAWVTSSERRHQVEDEKQILRWVAGQWGWACDPGPVNNTADAQLANAVREFQRAHRAEYSSSLAVTGVVDHATWGAFFDLYQEALAELLDADSAAMQAHRARVNLVSPGSIGFGERFPRDNPGVDNLRDQANRRVEILFFDPGEVPGSPADVYDPTLYTRVPLPCVPLQFATEVSVRIVEIRGLYQPGYTDPADPPEERKRAGYLDGYKSNDDAGRIFTNTVPRVPGQSWQRTWRKDTQYIEVRAAVDVFPAGSVVPHRLRVEWEWEDPDDPSDIDMTADAALIVDPNDGPAGSRVDTGDDNAGHCDFPSPGANAEPQFEAISPHRLTAGPAGSRTATSEVHGAEARVRFHVTDVSGDNFILRARVLPRPNLLPLAEATTGIMTMWKRIDVEYHEMAGAFALPLDLIAHGFEKAFVQMDFSAPISDPARQYLGATDAIANRASENYVRRPSVGRFQNEGRPGWFFLASAQLYSRSTGGALPTEIYAGPATLATAPSGTGDVLVVPTVLPRGAVANFIVFEEEPDLVRFFAGDPHSGTPVGSTSIDIEPIDFHPLFHTNLAGGAQDNAGAESSAYSFTDDYYPRSIVHAGASHGVGYDFPDSVQVTLTTIGAPPGERGAGGISPTINGHFAGRTILFSHSDRYNHRASSSLTIEGTFVAGEQVTVDVDGTAVTYTAVAGDGVAEVAAGLVALLRADATVRRRVRVVRTFGHVAKILAEDRGTAGNGIPVAASTTAAAGTAVLSSPTLTGGGFDDQLAAHTAIHELCHAFGFPHKCGYPTWEPAITRSCAMNYPDTWLYTDDFVHDGVDRFNTGENGVELCARHIDGIRKTHLEQNPELWRW